MSKVDFIPSRDGDLDAYEQNFVNKLAVHAPVLAIDPAEATLIRTNINNHRLAFANAISKRAESKSAGEENTSKRIKAVNDMRRAAKMIKSLTNYTNTI
ncbi:MAG: hypothetical protein ABI462_04040, partial [Ignavibacteria bacterium]